MAVKFEVKDSREEFEKLIPEAILDLIGGKNGHIEDDNYDEDDILTEVGYVEIKLYFDGYTIELDAVSSYHLTPIKS